MYQWMVGYHKDERLPTNLLLFLTEINFFGEALTSRQQDTHNEYYFPTFT